MFCEVENFIVAWRTRSKGRYRCQSDFHNIIALPITFFRPVCESVSSCTNIYSHFMLTSLHFVDMVRVSHLMPPLLPTSGKFTRSMSTFSSFFSHKVTRFSFNSENLTPSVLSRSSLSKGSKTKII